MIIKDLLTKKLYIPFKIQFKHALAERSETESVFVTIKSSNGKVGYGEGCPRLYVTNESVESALEFIENKKMQILEISSLQDLELFILENKKVIDLNPSAWCSVELALLDLLGKEEDKTVEEILSLPKLRTNFTYTAVIGNGDISDIKKFLKNYLDIGFQNFKLKLCGNFDKDFSKFELFRELNREDLTIRVDANKLWEDSTQAYIYLSELNYDFFAIEEPLKNLSYYDLIYLYERLGKKIILDESFTRIEDFNKYSKNLESFIVNIRISKMGGILRSLNIAKKACEKNVYFLIGAQVGETACLSRAAITVASTYYHNIIAQEGAFGDYLLEHDICNPSIKFGKGGMLNISNYVDSKTKGFGLNHILN